MDEQLLWDTQFGEPADKTVTFMCFWENGANIDWSVPELYRYNIYVPLLAGQDTTGLNILNRNGTDYYRLVSYDTIDDSEASKQTAPGINGYTYTGDYYADNLHAVDDSILYKDQDKNKEKIYREAYDVNFFYSRNTRNLRFVNGDETAKEVNIPFGTKLSGMAPDVEYYDENQKDIYKFGGWYTSPDCLDGSEYDLTNATMPDNHLTLYAKWELITYTITVSVTKEAADNGTNISSGEVKHDQPVPDSHHPDESTLKNPDDPTATFIGWFFMDENGVEEAFDFETMTVIQNMEIYAKWRSNQMKAVEINYVWEDTNGTKTVIADKESLMLRVGQTRTFEAKQVLHCISNIARVTSRQHNHTDSGRHWKRRPA